MPTAFHYFGEKSGWKKLSEDSRTTVLTPLLKLLTHMGMKADQLSLLSLLSLGGFVWLAGTAIELAGVFVLLHLMLDAMDGSLARYQKRTSKAGALTDVCVDETGFIVIMLTLLAYGYVDPLAGAWYIASYLALVAFLSGLDLAGHPYLHALPTKNLFYVLFYIEVFTGTPLTNTALLVFTAYTTALDVFLFFRLRWALS